MPPVIAARNLQKTFVSRKKQKGIAKFFFPEYENIDAVLDVSFTIERGERVAFIGPNGAGKSTTIKMLTGVFHPTGGSIEICGLDPYRKRMKASRLFGAVFGQRSQLWPHLSALRSFRLVEAIYDLDRKECEKRLKTLRELFQLDVFIDRPVRELSLGERMRCELVVSLLHQPQILFLDEPTIGLDLISKNAIRSLIEERARFEATTLFLTSHDIGDIEKVCDRVILIHRGRVMLDEPLAALKQRYAHLKRIKVGHLDRQAWKDRPGLILKQVWQESALIEADLSRIEWNSALAGILSLNPRSDLAIHDLGLEEIIHSLYTDMA